MRSASHQKRIAVYEILNQHNEWLTIEEIRDRMPTEYNTTQGITSRIRDLRLDENGGFHIPKRSRKGNTFEYRLTPGSGDPDLVYNPGPKTISQVHRLKQQVSELQTENERLKRELREALAIW